MHGDPFARDLCYGAFGSKTAKGFSVFAAVGYEIDRVCHTKALGFGINKGKTVSKSGEKDKSDALGLFHFFSPFVADQNMPSRRRA